MVFLTAEKNIKENDTVIIYMNPSTMYSVLVTPMKLNKKNELVPNYFQTSFGSFKVDSLIGRPFGSKITLLKGTQTGWAHVLRPTPELWTLTLPHRTQILYAPDISTIIFQLDLRPGKIVIEAGTGSGSLTHALARSIYPNGHVYTFDFHETRVKTAQIEFENHGLSTNVTVAHRDVCSDGYGDEMLGIADAVFLDLPTPSKVIPHAMKCLKQSGGRIASFSPCIEQVQNTCEVLSSLSFIDVKTVECLQREFNVVSRTLNRVSLSSSDSKEEKLEKFVALMPQATMPGHTGYLTFASLPRRSFITTSTIVVDSNSGKSDTFTTIEEKQPSALNLLDDENETDIEIKINSNSGRNGDNSDTSTTIEEKNLSTLNLPDNNTDIEMKIETD